MKRTLLVILCCLFSIMTQAQTEHMKFMGIPIDGKITQFHRSISQKRFTRVTNISDLYLYEGVFAGYSATVFVNKTPEDSIYSVMVAIPCSNIKNCQSIYEDFKYRLIRKYNCVSDSFFVEKLETDTRGFLNDVNEGVLSLNTYIEESSDEKKKTTIYVESLEDFNKSISLAENLNDSIKYKLLKDLLKLRFNILFRGSLGSIVITSGSFSSLGELYNHAVVIAYVDEENSRKNEIKKEEDL